MNKHTNNYYLLTYFTLNKSNHIQKSYTQHLFYLIHLIFSSTFTIFSPLGNDFISDFNIPPNNSNNTKYNITIMHNVISTLILKGIKQERNLCNILLNMTDTNAAIIGFTNTTTKFGNTLVLLHSL